MSGARQNASKQFFVQADRKAAFDACIQAGEEIGTIKQSNPTLGSLTIRTGLKIWPPQNPVTFQVSVMPAANGGSEVRCEVDGFDGAIGLGSPQKTIDQFCDAVAAALESGSAAPSTDASGETGGSTADRVPRPRKKSGGMKKALLWGLGIVVILAIIGALCGDSDDALPGEYFKYREEGNAKDGKYAVIIDFLEDDDIWEKYHGKVTVPAEIDGLPVREVGYLAFSDAKLITSLRFAEGIEKIEMGGFSNECELKEIVFPNSLKIINKVPLAKDLTELHFPRNCTIESPVYLNELSECPNLKVLELPSKVKPIRSWMYSGGSIRKINPIEIICSSETEFSFQSASCPSLDGFNPEKVTNKDLDELCAMYESSFSNTKKSANSQSANSQGKFAPVGMETYISPERAENLRSVFEPVKEELKKITFKRY